MGCTATTSSATTRPSTRTFQIENFYVSNLRPGPQSILFSDPSVIIKPKTTTRLACQRCGCDCAREETGRMHAASTRMILVSQASLS